MDNQLLKTIEKLVSISSHTENKAGVDQVGEFIRGELDFMNCERFLHAKRGDLLVFSSKENIAGPKILLSGHSDTVFPAKDEFPIKYEGNRMYGPGVLDMKAGLLVIMETLKQLNKNNKLKNITFTLVPDEEQASLAHKDTLAGIYKQNTYGLVYEEGTVESTPGITDYQSGRRAIVTSRKGFGAAKYILTGPGGHSGVVAEKEKRHNTIILAAKLIKRLDELADYDKGSTTNPGLISGGHAVNVIPTKAELVVDYRVKTLEERNRLRSEYEKLAQEFGAMDSEISVKIEWLYDVPPMPSTSETEKLVNIAQNIASKQETRLILEDRSGGSDGNQMAVQGVTVLDGFGPQGDGEHSPNEFIYIDSLQPTINFSISFVESLLEL